MLTEDTSPILTYIRQGCKKKGVKPAKHGIIHELNTKPRPLDGEPKLGFKPIRLEITVTGERLARESRVNYSKLVTVEHNVKVFFIGNIHPDDFENIVPQAVDRCWTDKIHKRVKKGVEKRAQVTNNLDHGHDVAMAQRILTAVW